MLDIPTSGIEYVRRRLRTFQGWQRRRQYLNAQIPPIVDAPALEWVGNDNGRIFCHRIIDRVLEPFRQMQVPGHDVGAWLN
jgi:S-adenosylmethionine:diacylglycerol 3-amino-3-carboxypropyl transferase